MVMSMTTPCTPRPLRRTLLGAVLAVTGTVALSGSPAHAGVAPGSSTCFDTGAPAGAGVVLNGTAARSSGRGFLNFHAPGPNAEPDANSSINYTGDASIANAIVTSASDTGEVCVYSSNTTDAIADVSGFIAPDARLVFGAGTATEGETVRLLDTRTDFRRFNPGETQCFRPVGNGIEGQTLFVNATAAGADGRGFLNFYPDGATSAPDANSAINYVAGRNIANSVLVTLGAEGRLCVYSSNSTHIVLDSAGGVTADDFRAANADLSAQRILDTRSSSGPIAAGASVCVDTDAAPGEAVVLNATAAKSSQRGFLNVYPAGATAAPDANSTLNFRPDANIANGLIVPAGTDGRICVFANQSTQAVLDVAGYLTAGTFVPFNPDGSADRVLDTRS